MSDERVMETTAGAWSKRKKDAAPRGTFRHRSGAWAIRFTCGAGHVHQEQVGPLKSDAVRTHFERRARAHDEPGWCPDVERRQARERAAAERARERARMTFREYAADYLEWARDHKRSWAKDRSRLNGRILPALGDRKLDEITTADVERFLTSLRNGDRVVTGATVNRSRDLLSGMFKRAIRLGLVTVNPVTGIPKLKEPGGRIVYLPPATPERAADEEEALHEALPPDLRPLLTVSVHTGLRWSEQSGLQWRDMDVLSGVIGVGRSKNGYGRRVPMNSTVRAALIDLATRRARPDDPTEQVFAQAYRTVARAFERAVERAKEALRDAGKDATHLDGYTWHGNRHTFASRLVMAGVDPLTVKELGGWRTLAMVQRYAHLSPGHLADAVERLVSPPCHSALRRNFDGAAAALATVGASRAQVCENQGTEG